LRTRVVHELDDDKRRAIAAWFSANGDSLPTEVRELLTILEPYLAAQQSLTKKLDATMRDLRRALGFTPSSEKRRHSASASDKLPPVPPTPQVTLDPAAKIEQRIARGHHLAKWHQDKQRKQRQRIKRLKEKLAKMVIDKKSKSETKATPREVEPLEDVERTPEEAAQDARAIDLFGDHLRQGGAPDPSMLSVNETLMPAGAVLQTTEQHSVAAEIPAALAGARVAKIFDEQRVRYDFAVTVRRLELDVQKMILVDHAGERHVISGSTHEFGPPRYGVTWEALATLAVLGTQFATPLHRLAILFSTPEKKFTAGALSRMLRYVAIRLLPIYLALADQLADADILAGDDTSCRVLEVSSFHAGLASAAVAEANASNTRKPPWSSYATTKAAEISIGRCEAAKQARLQRRAAGDREALPTAAETPTLGVLIGRKLGFEWPRRDGDGAKKAIHTTVISGRAAASDPRSLIVFYRSHLGSCGNLVEQLLRFRAKERRRLLLQGDLSTTNLVTARELLERFEIVQVACYAHARRPFAVYQDDDPEHCEYMLHLFLGLAIHESTLDSVGRNESNVRAVRQTESREMWNEILELATSMTERWSKATNLGTAARYIINHFAELAAYLDDPRLEATNNLRERMLRTEKLIENSSMFRRSLEGRFVLDVVRTILQTAVAAGAPVNEYLVAILRARPEDISERPAEFTPHAWMARHNAE